MKKKKLTALLLVLCMGVAALSGCGSREDAKEDVKEAVSYTHLTLPTIS